MRDDAVQTVLGKQAGLGIEVAVIQRGALRGIEVADGGFGHPVVRVAHVAAAHFDDRRLIRIAETGLARLHRDERRGSSRR